MADLKRKAEEPSSAGRAEKRAREALDVAKASVVLGLQWGDEGKGKLVDILSQDADFCCRFAGGNNAGHTVAVGKEKYDFHLLPSGIINPTCTSLIGNGVVVNLAGLFDEITHNLEIGDLMLGWESRLKVSDRAHVVFGMHQDIDGLQEIEKSKKGSSIGTTKKGIGPCYSAKADRFGVRVSELIDDFDGFQARLGQVVDNYKKRFADLEVDVVAEVERYRGLVEKLKPLVVDSVALVHNALDDPTKRILIEGANATMLDLDFGTYPYVTSSNCTVGGVCTGLGIPPQRIGSVFGVVKAYTTRVGAGAFPTECLGEIGDSLQSIGKEFGVTTGRKRRCGWLDVMVVRYACRLNGVTDICLTKLDILDTFKQIKIGTGYTYNGERLQSMPAHQKKLESLEVEYITLPGWQEDISKVQDYEGLPANAKAYIAKVEELCGVRVKWVGVGPGRENMITIY